MRKANTILLVFATVLGVCLFAAGGIAGGLEVTANNGHGHGGGGGGGGGGSGGGGGVTPCGQNADGTYCWMSPDIGAAWAGGYTGDGVSMTFVDDFSSSTTYTGDLGLGTQTQLHGLWTTEAAGMVAPGATIFQDDFSTEDPITLQDGSLNVVNASYELNGKTAFYSSSIWSLFPQEQSMIDAAQNGDAVVSKAAGNEAIAVGASLKGNTDYLNLGLTGTQSAIFAGALDHNGTVSDPASLASYSNYAGSNVDVQNHFLVVGVEGDKTGLYGTSLAAPIISGYAAIVGSKFTSATPTQITNQLLDTARTDTLVNYNAATYGQGEASLSRALAPTSIH